MCADTFFVDEYCTFAQRGVVLMYIAVLPLLCGQWPRQAEMCGGSTDAVPGQVVDMPVIVLTDVQKTVETFHTCSSWSILLINLKPHTAASVLHGRVCNAQWSMSRSEVVFWFDAGHVLDHSPLPVPFCKHCVFQGLQDCQATQLA